ncbi:hypothetical protein ACIQWA_00680 [Kitasatospora sp. NPDC098652]|uniref:hypothetical protein n=1 Tax=Kitasatospora sp. NPDC098652 TaxID=3364095 RepID=UPI00382F9A27
MPKEPDVLDLRLLHPPPEDRQLEVRPIVNGRDLLAEVSPHVVGGPRYAGVGPRRLLGPDGPLLATAVPHEVRLAWGGCGYERCCGALYVTVRRDGDQIVWTGWRDPAFPDFGLPELRFDAGPYETEVRRAEAESGWEAVTGAVARLLEARLRGRADWLLRWDCEVDAVWSHRENPDLIHLVLLHPRDRYETDLPWVQFGITLPVSADDPSAQAEQLEARLTAADPRATAQVWGGSHHAEQLGYPWPPVDPDFG